MSVLEALVGLGFRPTHTAHGLGKGAATLWRDAHGVEAVGQAGDWKVMWEIRPGVHKVVVIYSRKRRPADREEEMSGKVSAAVAEARRFITESGASNGEV